METTSKNPAKWAKNAGLFGIGLCALCCAMPLIGIMGGVGLLVTIAAFAEKIGLALLIISAALFAFWLYKKRQAPACSVDCECKANDAGIKKIQNAK